VLQPEYLVEIRCVTTKGYGSGYLVRPDLVLTACHVIAPPDAGLPQPVTIEVRPLGDDDGQGSWQSATVAWPDPAKWAAAAPATDIALLAFQPPANPVVVPAAEDVSVGWDSLPSDQPLKITAVGFPRFTQDTAANTRDTHQIFGSIAPLSALKAKSFEIEYEGRNPKAEEDWKGLSGAAVFSASNAKRVIGVLTVRVRDGLYDFRAVRIEAATIDPAFSKLINPEVARPVLAPGPRYFRAPDPSEIGPKRFTVPRAVMPTVHRCIHDPPHFFTAVQVFAQDRCPYDGTPLVSDIAVG
jgi:hypothetical protein